MLMIGCIYAFFAFLLLGAIAYALFCMCCCGRARKTDDTPTSCMSKFWAALSHPEHGRSSWAWMSEWFIAIMLQVVGGMPQQFFSETFQRDTNLVPFYLDGDWQVKPLWGGESGGSILPSGPLIILSHAGVFLFALFCLVPALSSKQTWSERFAEFHVTLLGHFYANGAFLILQGPATVFMGEWRPDSLDYCNIDPVKALEVRTACNARGLTHCPAYAKDICLNNMSNAVGRGQGRSFISGHAGFMLAAYLYCALWLAGKLRIVSARYRERSLWKSSLVHCLLCAPFLVGISRILDGNHHWWNVALGFLLGIFAGVHAYLSYFPSPWANFSWSPRAMHEAEGDFTNDSATWKRGGLLRALQTNDFSAIIGGAGEDISALPTTDNGVKKTKVLEMVDSSIEGKVSRAA